MPAQENNHRMEGKPSSGPDPRGCSTGHSAEGRGRGRGVSPLGSGMGVCRAGWGKMGRGEASQRQGEKVQPPQAFRAARPTSHSQGGHRGSGAAGPARPETQVRKRTVGDPGTGAARSGAAAGTCPAWPAGRAVLEELGGPGGDPASDSVRGRGWEVTGGQETAGSHRWLVLSGRTRREPRADAARPLGPCLGGTPFPHPEAEHAPPGGAARASTCPVALAPRVGTSPFHSGGLRPRVPGRVGGAGTSPGWDCGSRAPPGDRRGEDSCVGGRRGRVSRRGPGRGGESPHPLGTRAHMRRLARRDPRHGSRGPVPAMRRRPARPPLPSALVQHR